MTFKKKKIPKFYIRVKFLLSYNKKIYTNVYCYIYVTTYVFSLMKNESV